MTESLESDEQQKINDKIRATLEDILERNNKGKIYSMLIVLNCTKTGGDQVTQIYTDMTRNHGEMCHMMSVAQAYIYSFLLSGEHGDITRGREGN